VRYTRTHEWVEAEGEGIVTVGISTRAQEAFPEIVFVELPEEGEEFEQDEPLGSIESIDGELMTFHAPVTGEVIEINDALENSPGLINRSPEGDGWLVKIRMEVPAELNALMTPEEYEDYEEDILEQESTFDDEEEEEFF
jgi:glycine cleavage system H protein